MPIIFGFGKKKRPQLNSQPEQYHQPNQAHLGTTVRAVTVAAPVVQMPQVAKPIVNDDPIEFSTVKHLRACHIDLYNLIKSELEQYGISQSKGHDYFNQESAKVAHEKIQILIAGGCFNYEYFEPKPNPGIQLNRTQIKYFLTSCITLGYDRAVLAVFEQRLINLHNTYKIPDHNYRALVESDLLSILEYAITKQRYAIFKQAFEQLQSYTLNNYAKSNSANYLHNRVFSLSCHERFLNYAIMYNQPKVIITVFVSMHMSLRRYFTDKSLDNLKIIYASQAKRMDEKTGGKLAKLIEECVDLLKKSPPGQKLSASVIYADVYSENLDTVPKPWPGKSR